MVTNDINDIIRLFVRFLKNVGAYTNFKKNFKNKWGRIKWMSLDYYFQIKPFVYYVSDAFNWYLSVESLSYWSDINKKWINLLEEKKLA